jgi:hypothetical protein
MSRCASLSTDEVFSSVGAPLHPATMRLVVVRVTERSAATAR